MKNRLLLLCLILLLPMLLFAGIGMSSLVLDTGGHTANIRSAIFTRDGRFLVSAGSDMVIRIWDVETGKTVRTIRWRLEKENEGKIYAMALSPNNRYLAVGGLLAYDPPNRYVIGGVNSELLANEPKDRAVIRIHDFETGKVVGLLRGHQNVVQSLDFSPDGRYLVSGSADSTLRVWEIATSPMRPIHLLKGHSDLVNDARFSPDGRRIVSGSRDKSVKFWDAVRGIKIMDLENRHSDQVLSVAFSPDGRYIVTGGADRLALLWDARTGNFIKELYKHSSDVIGLSFSPDGNRLLAGGAGDNYMCPVLAVPSGEILTRFQKHDNAVFATAYSPGGKLVATAGGDNFPIYLWNPDDGKVAQTLVGKARSVQSVGFARDGQSIAFGSHFDFKGINQRGPLQSVISLKVGDDYKVNLSGEVKDETPFLRAIETVGEYSLKTVIAQDPNLQVMRNGRLHKTITRNSISGYSHRSYTLTRDGRQIVSGGGGGRLEIYDAETGDSVRKFTGHTSDVIAVAVSPDNRTLISGSADQTVRLWDIASGKNLLTILVTTDNECVAWTPEGYYTSSLNGDQYFGRQVWNVGTDESTYHPAVQYKDWYRPDVVAEYLKTRDIQLALKIADEKRGKSFSAASKPAVTDIAASYPPLVFIAAPDGDTSDTEMVTVRAEAKPVPNTPPVTDLKVLVNGVRVGGGSGSRWQGQVRLQPGVNTLAVIAANERAVSEPEVKKITYTGRAAATAKPNLVLLAIGVKTYQNKGLSLGFADQDALKMAAMFKAQEGVLFNRVHAEILTNEQVTREEVIDKLDWMNKTSSQNDVVVLFLSGHGSLSKGNYYFWTHKHDPQVNPERYDVKWSTLIDGLTAVPGTKPILFVDSCRAAAATGARRKGDEGLTEALKDLKQNYQGVVFFAASKDNEDSIEMDSLGHGAFTYSLLDGLKGNADVPPKDQIVYINELGNWVRAHVRKLTGEKQHAVYEEPPEKSGFQPFPIFVLPKR